MLCHDFSAFTPMWLKKLPFICSFRWFRRWFRWWFFGGWWSLTGLVELLEKIISHFFECVYSLLIGLVKVMHFLVLLLPCFSAFSRVDITAHTMYSIFLFLGQCAPTNCVLLWTGHVSLVAVWFRDFWLIDGELNGTGSVRKCGLFGLSRRKKSAAKFDISNWLLEINGWISIWNKFVPRWSDQKA